MLAYTSCKAEISLDVTLEDYTKAMLLSDRRVGLLRFLPLGLFAAAGLLLVGFGSMQYFIARYNSFLVPLLLFLLAGMVLVFFFYILPDNVRTKAKKSYASFHKLFEGQTIQFYPDTVITRTSCLALTDSYALMLVCIETPQLFVLLKDRDRMLIIPKRCITEDQQAMLVDFLRLVFSRKRRVFKNWIF